MLRNASSVVLLGGLALATLACFVAAALPFPAVRGYLDSLAGDGSAEPYTPQLHTRLRIYFACLGIVGAAGTAWITAVRSRAKGPGAKGLAQLGSDARTLGGDTIRVLRVHRGPLIATALLALMTRLPYLDQPIRYDEAHSYVNYARRPSFVTISTYQEPNNHVFHNLCVHAVTRVLGTAEWVIRLPAFAAGVLTVPATYLLGCVWGGRGVGLLAALAVAASSPLIGYSANARGYSLVCLITVCLVLLAQYNLRRTNRAAWGVMALLAAIGFWTVPTMLYALAMLLVWLAGLNALMRRSASGIPWLAVSAFAVATAGLTLFLYSPILVVEGPGALVGNRFIASPGPREFLERLPATVSATARLLLRDLPVPAIALLGIGWFAALSPRRFRSGPAPGLLLLSGGVCVLLVLIQRVLPPARIWIFLLPLMFPVAVWGVMSLIPADRSAARPAAMALIAALLVIWPLINLVRHDSIRRSREGAICPDAERAIVWLKTALRPREPIITIVPASAPLVYYALRHDLPLEHFEWPGGPNTRDDSAVVVVNPRWDASQTIDHVLETLGLAESFGDSRITLLKSYPSADLYRLTRRPSRE